MFGAIGLSIFTSLLVGSAGFFAFHKESGRLRVMLASPLRFLSIVIMDIIKNLTIVAIVSFIIIITGLALGGKLLFNPFNPIHYVALLMVFIAALFAYGLGLLIAPTIKLSRATGGVVALGLMFVFLTGIWWSPKEWLPQPLKYFADVFPPARAFELSRDILVISMG